MVFPLSDEAVYSLLDQLAGYRIKKVKALQAVSPDGGRKWTRALEIHGEMVEEAPPGVSCQDGPVFVRRIAQGELVLALVLDRPHKAVSTEAIRKLALQCTAASRVSAASKVVVTSKTPIYWNGKSVARLLLLRFQAEDPNRRLFTDLPRKIGNRPD